MRTTTLKHLFLICILYFLYGCEDEKDYLFLVVNDSGIDFSNDLNYTQELNPYTYRNYYNGAGIGVADFDNDGLEDIYFSGNQVDNALYRNLGNLKFEKVESSPILNCTGSWSTGVSIVDINQDGLKDIYVCKAGPPEGPRRYNELFINNGNFEFTESAEKYGLRIKGFSIHATFFDFDKDGDLDCYLLNNSLRSVGGYNLQ
ncbi:MAG: VCBS repeat-containing protein, partial [Saprospiraceae bacterium]|nr:VCBS repeat-containing protein [Saprospiraceae bacterium]